MSFLRKKSSLIFVVSILFIFLFVSFLITSTAWSLTNFENFDFKDIKVEDRGDPSKDKVEFKGTFSLNSVGDGTINPLTETVTVEFGSFAQTIPVGSFVREVEGFVFEGSPPGLKKIDIKDNGKFKITARGLALNEIGPVETVTLIIGNDGGAFDLIAKRQIQIRVDEPLEGIDADNDGVRDDLQNAIAARQQDEVKRRALTQFAISLQDAIITGDSNLELDIMRSAKKLTKAIDCVFSRFENPSEEIDFIEFLAVNTNMRGSAYSNFNEHLSGGFFGSPDAFSTACE